MKRTFIMILFVLSYTLCVAQGENPKQSFGNLTSNTKVIDVDRFCTLSSGLCVVIKGDKEALIDVNGNFIVDWGKYKFTGNGDREHCNQLQFYNGLVKVKDLTTFKSGFIDKTGNAVIPLKYNNLRSVDFSVANMAYVEDPFIKTLHTAIDINGRTLFDLSSFEVEPEKAGDLLFATRSMKYVLHWKSTEDDLYLEDNKNLNRFLVDDVSKFGFIDKTGKVVIPLTFQFANQFSEGMASVGKLDEFGAIKWGYIDLSGKLVIPYQYTYEPGPFHSGLALVRPTEIADFKYAYIDKKGNVKIKIGEKSATTYPGPLTYKFETRAPLENKHPLSEVGCFVHGFAVWQYGYDYLLLDTAGNFSKFENFLSENAYPLNRDLRYKLKKIDDKGFYFTVNKLNVFENDQYGLIDFSGKVVYYPNFGSFTPDLFGNYSLCDLIIGKEEKFNKPIIRQGIINKEGFFTVIKSEKKEVW